MTAPALSIVVTGRNDNWGGDFNERFFATLAFNNARLAERGIPFEFIFVEWNPVAGKPLLCELLAREFPALTGGVLRRFVAASEYSTAFTQNPKVAFFEYLPKNAGIRRANAPFILATNADVFLGRHVVDVISSGRLAPGTVYRAARHDIRQDIELTGIGWTQLEDSTNQVRQPRLKPPLFAGGTGDFVLANRAIFHQIRGFNEVYRAARGGVDTNLLVKARANGYPIVDIGGPVYHINHEGSMRLSKHTYDLSRTPWGNMRWHSRHVTYDNPDDWGLGNAPERILADGTVMLDFDWRAVPPLVELRRIVRPAS